MISRTLLILCALFLFGCKPSGGSTGPPSAQATSAAYATVADRSAFLHQYVTFRRTYETLDFNIMVQNNGGGGVPGPSDYDVRLVATVPAAELQAWVPASIAASPAAPSARWLKSVPTALDLSGVTEWYEQGSRTVGIDRARSLVVYRANSTPGDVP